MLPKYSNIKLQIKSAFVLTDFTHIVGTDGAEYNVSSIVLDGVSKNIKSILRENLLAVGNVIELSGENCVKGETATDSKGNVRTDDVGMPVVYTKDHFRCNNFNVIDTDYRIEVTGTDMLVAEMIFKQYQEKQAAKNKVTRRLDLSVPSTVVEPAIDTAESITKPVAKKALESASTEV